MGEVLKLMYHESCKVMTAEGRLHPHPLYFYIAVTMFLQTGACHRDIILGIDYHRIFHVLRLIARLYMLIRGRRCETWCGRLMMSS